jgi:hypothetical protein
MIVDNYRVLRKYLKSSFHVLPVRTYSEVHGFMQEAVKERDMSRPYQIILLILLMATMFACGLITNPINQAKGLASTAEAVASAMPIETLQALPSAMPDVSGMLNPTGKPASDWKGIPIMPQATAGQEFSEHNYSFKAPVAATDVQAFYDEKMKSLGWQSAVGFQVTGKGGIMIFQNGKDLLTVTITPDLQNDREVVVIFQK